MTGIDSMLAEAAKLDMDESTPRTNMILGEWAMEQLIEDPKGDKRHYDFDTQFAVVSVALTYVKLRHTEFSVANAEAVVEVRVRERRKWLAELKSSITSGEKKVATEALDGFQNDFNSDMSDWRLKLNSYEDEGDYNSFAHIASDEIRERAVAAFRKQYPSL